MLAVIFVNETLIMLMLPRVMPADVSWLAESLLDAWLLTLTVAPIFWMLLVRPLRLLAEFRTEMLAQTIAAQENERRRIARDLHDEVGQSLTSLLIGLRTVADSESLESSRSRAEELREVTANVLDDIKRLARGLRPSVLDDIGLTPALERLIQDFTRTHGVDVSLDATGLAGARFSETFEVTVYRLVQESLTNIAKHAQAQNAHVSLQRHGEQMRVEVQDDGRGFVALPTKQLMANGHMGLMGMQERAALLGGSLVIEAKPENGTHVIAMLPLAH
jgi:signal transduction histidine kinase